MSTRTAKFVSAIFASLLAGVPFATTSHGATNAADTSCLSGPKGAPPQGGHWYYRVDRATKRNCWYVGDAKQKPARTASENSQPAANAAPSPTDTAIQPSIANARAELPSPQTRIEDPGAATVQQAPAMIVNTDQRANAPDANAQRSVIVARWPDFGVSSPANPAPATVDAVSNAQPTNPAAAAPPAVARVALAAADSSAANQTGSIQTLLLVILGALTLAGLMGSAIFRFGGSRRVDRRAIWDYAGSGVLASSAYPKSAVPMRRADMPRELRTADDPDERIAQMLQRLARSAAT